MTVQYQLGVDAGIALNVGGANEAFVSGLNKLGLPDMMREVVTVSQFRTDFAVEFTGEGKHGRITYGGNLVLGDTNGQDALKAALKANSKLTDCRVYLNLVDFLAPDLANDANAAFQVVKHTPGEAQKNGTFPISGEMCTNGLYCYFTAHMVDDSSPTIAFVAATTPGTTSATITDSGNGFVTAGFKAGQTLIVESAVNNGQFTILSVAAGTITLKVGDTLTSHATAAGTELHGGTL
jgi:hypothetical protein